MATISRFEEINAWKTARELTNLIYDYSTKGNFNRDYGLRDQIRRSTVSVMSNIAEGFESQTQATFIKYLGIAKASAGEVRSLLYMTLDLGYISQNEFNKVFNLSKKVSIQIYRFILYLRSQPNSRRISDNSVYYLID
jgi:four helix bundle protein